jgi:hypothetical protein
MEVVIPIYKKTSAGREGFIYNGHAKWFFQIGFLRTGTVIRKG